MSQGASMLNADKNNIGQIPEDEAQLQRMQIMDNQQAMNKPSGNQVSLALLLPIILPQLDKRRTMQLQGLYVRFRRNNINKEECVRHLRSLVGDHMLKEALCKVQQGQRVRQDVKDASAAGKPTGNEGRDAGEENLNAPLGVGGVLIGATKPGVVVEDLSLPVVTAQGAGSSEPKAGVTKEEERDAGEENLNAPVVTVQRAGSSEPKVGVTKKDSTAGSPEKGKRKLSSTSKNGKMPDMMQDFKKKRKIKLVAAVCDTRLTDNQEVMAAEIKEPDSLPLPTVEDCAKNAKEDAKETAEKVAGKTFDISVAEDLDKSTEEAVKDPEVPLEVNVKMSGMPLEKDVVSQSFQQPISTPADIPFEGPSSATAGVTRSYPSDLKLNLVEAVPPGEKVYVQGLNTLQLSDNIATAMATFLSHTPELCRRWMTDDKRLRDLAAEKDKLEEELRRTTAAARHANEALLDEQKAHADLKAERTALISKLAAERNEYVACIKKMEWIVGCHEGKEQKLADELNVSRKALEEKEERLKATDDKLKQREADLAKSERDSSSMIGALTEDVARLKEEKRWLIVEGIPRSFEIIRGSAEFRDAIAELAAAADFVGRQDGMRDGIKLQQSGQRIDDHQYYKADAEGDLANAYQTFSDINLPVMDELVSTPGCEDLSALKALLLLVPKEEEE